jgi:catechol 2,3-dioxygenase-like lactoylglutathione lyase family enzyme
MSKVSFRWDHVGIVVKDLDKSIDFYVNNLGATVGKIYEFSDVEAFFDKEEPGHSFRYTFLMYENGYLELLQPKRGPFLDILKERGDGAVAEVCLEVSDMAAFYDEMKKKGILLTDMHWRPFKGKKYIGSPSGNKFGYLPLEATGGTLIELLERGWQYKMVGNKVTRWNRSPTL